jgi:hypothetical protein
LPKFPDVQPRQSITPRIDEEASLPLLNHTLIFVALLIIIQKTQLARLQAHRAHLCSEYTHIAKATRRALHELELATIDLRAAEMRRRVADAQLEMAKTGTLGIDHHVASAESG